MMGLAMRRTALLPTAILLILTVAACGENNSSTEASATDPPTQTGGAMKPGRRATNPGEADGAVEVQKPKLDVIIDRFRVPTHVKREQYFELTMALKNNSVGTQVPGIANVEIRATLDHPGGLINVAVDNMWFPRLWPGTIQVQTGQGRAPHKTGVWTLRAVVQPVNYIDDANNSRDVLLIVD